MAIRSNRELLEGRRRRRLGSLGTGGWGEGSKSGAPKNEKALHDLGVCLSVLGSACCCNLQDPSGGRGGREAVG